VIEIRYAKAKAEQNKVGGYAALFNSPSSELHERGRTFVETIMPGAFSRSLRSGQQDVKLLYQHKGDQILARTRNGSLRLTEDEKGLAFEADLPDTTLGRDVRALLDAGTLSEMSFGFNVLKDTWNEGKTRRSLHEVELAEISIVTDAAYPQTTAALRSADSDTWADRVRIRIARNRIHG